MRIKTNGQKSATGPEHAPRFKHERACVINMVHHIDAEEPIEGSRRPREVFSAAASEKRRWCGRSCALQHVGREVEPGNGVDTTPKLGKPVTSPAAHFGDLYAPQLTDKALKNGLDALISVSFVALVVRRRDEIVIH